MVATSVAVTRNLWRPTLTSTASGESQAKAGLWSSWQANVPCSSASNLNFTVFFVVFLGGVLVRVVSGSAVSTTNETESGLGSVLPAASLARTAKVFGPSASGPRMCWELV